MYTYDVQYPEFTWDQVKEMGPIDAAGAVEALRNFPFRELLERADSLGAESTAPTITFRSKPDGAILSFCMRAADYREVYMESEGEKVAVGPVDEQFMVGAVESFFSGSHPALCKQMANHPGAVTQRPFLKRLKSLFLSK